MALKFFEENVSIHQTMGDNPNTDNSLSAAELKAMFDKPAEMIQAFINDYIIPAINIALDRPQVMVVERGLTPAQLQALEDLLKLAVYKDDPTGAAQAFKEAFYNEIPATGIVLSSTIVVASPGVKKQLAATVAPADSTDEVVWTSSNPAVATVDSNGLVTTIATGKCTITAVAGSASATCSVSVQSASGLIHSHSYTATVTKEATCTEPGVKTYTCLCGESYTEEIPATGHNYVNGVCTECLHNVDGGYG